MNLLIGAVTIGLILALLALGVFITYRVFGSLDLTADGSYGVGAAVAGALLVHGTEPILATAGGAGAGAVAGTVTGLMHTWLRVPRLLAGILTTTALYSIILFVMHGGDLSLGSHRTLVTVADAIGSDLTGTGGNLTLFGVSVSARNWMGLVLTFMVVGSTAEVLNIFLRTNVGLAMRATGNNANMARALGIDVDRMIVLGLAVSNGLIGLSGAIFAQFVGLVNIQLGAGIIVSGLASLMIGQTLLGSRGVGRAILAAVGGSVLFRLLVAAVLRAGLDPNALKLLTALFVLGVIVLPGVIRRWARLRPPPQPIPEA